MSQNIDKDHPLNDQGFPPVTLEVTHHRDRTVSLRVSREMLSMLEQGMTAGAAAAYRFADEPWTTREFQELQARRFEAVSRVLASARKP